MKTYFRSAAPILAAPVVAALIVASPLAAGPTDFGQGTHVGRVDGLPPLPNNLRNLYRDFRTKTRYFAAFAVNFDTHDGFFIQNFHEAGRARAAALEGCAQVSQAEGCVIYAVAMPESLPVGQSKAAGFSEWAADDFQTVYQESRKPGTYAAFALSGASHHGYGFGYANEADARDTAIAYCMRGVAQDMAEVGPRGRAFARLRNWNRCQVVDVTFTPPE